MPATLRRRRHGMITRGGPKSQSTQGLFHSSKRSTFSWGGLLFLGFGLLASARIWILSTSLADYAIVSFGGNQTQEVLRMQQVSPAATTTVEAAAPTLDVTVSRHGMPEECLNPPELCVRKGPGRKGGCSLRPCAPQCQVYFNTSPEDRQPPVFPYPNRFHISRQGPARGVKPVVMGQSRTDSGCGLSKKYKFIYLHVLKSGGSTMKSFLSSGLCDPEPCSDRNVFQVVDCEFAFQQYPNFLTWSFVRNPYSRYYSAFSMANAPLFRKNTTQEIDIEEYLNATSFRKHELSGLSQSHFTPQTQFLFNRYHCPVFDVIGHLETVDEDLPYILSLIDSPELWNKYRKDGLRTNQGTNFGAQSKGDNFSLPVALQSPVVQEKVRSLFQDDFYYFGFDKEVVPPR